MDRFTSTPLPTVYERLGEIITTLEASINDLPAGGARPPQLLHIYANFLAHSAHTRAIESSVNAAAAANFNARVCAGFPSMEMPNYVEVAQHAWLAVLSDSVMFLRKGLNAEKSARSRSAEGTVGTPSGRGAASRGKWRGKSGTKGKGKASSTDA